MACYYDSSFILAAILNNEENAEFLKIWDEDSIRLSSNILKIECIISIRRLSLSGGKSNKEWEKKSIQEVCKYFPSITFRKYDEEIEKLIMEDVRFSLCRTLDAIHLASAFYFKPYLQEEIIICTLDKRMRKTAKVFNFKIFPDSS